MPDDDRVAGAWTAGAIDLLRELGEREDANLGLAASWFAEAIGAGGLVHLFGAGHSRMAVEEMFPRYGSFPGFHPMVELSMTFHTQVVGANGQRQAMFIERVPGLAEVVLSNFAFRPSDVVVVFSVSGTSAVPVELAAGARSRGLRTIGVTSVAHSMKSTPPAGNQRLLDVVDLVIDLGTPPGDALVRVPGLDTPVGPGSTVAAVAVVNELKVRTADLLVRGGTFPPVISAPIVVGAQRSADLFNAAYDDHARRIGYALGHAGDARLVGGVLPVPNGAEAIDVTGAR